MKVYYNNVVEIPSTHVINNYFVQLMLACAILNGAIILLYHSISSKGEKGSVHLKLRRHA